jgi:hypothetical protein
MTKQKRTINETIYLQEAAFGRTRVLKHPPGVLETQAGRANGLKSTKTMMVMQNVSKQPLTLRLFQLKI